MHARRSGLSARHLMLLALAAAAGCGGGSSATGPGTPVATTIAIAPSGGTLDAVGATLQLGATVKDQSGHAMSGAPVVWSSSDTAVVRVTGAGLATAVRNGTATITAASDTAHGRVSLTVAQAPRAIVKVSGDLQRGASGQPLAAPLVVEVDDRLQHPVAGVTVAFTPASGDGSVSPASAASGADGRAQGAWTLGAASGAQSVTASASGVNGVSAAFTATDTTPAPVPSIATIVPDTLVEGQSAKITGTNFSTTTANDSVTIDGRAATVTAASATSLTVTVPASSCQPARSVTVGVTVGGQTGTRSGVPVQPASFTSLAVGQEALLQNTGGFCLELRGSATSGETYIMGLSAPAETPGATLPFVITTTAGASGVGPMLAGGPAVAASYAGSPAPGSGAMSPELRHAMKLAAGQAAAEARIRAWDAAHLAQMRAQRAPAVSAAMVGNAAASLPAVGDTLTLHVPDFSASTPCTSYATIRAVVRVVGSAGIWVSDVTNPTTDSLTLAEIQSASNAFDSQIYATDTAYFGHPSDIDGNGRIIVALTWQVNQAMAGLAGFVFSGDLFPGGCAGSNGGEIYYGEVPDDSAGTAQRLHADVVASLPRLIAHEFTHIIQYSQRLILHNGQAMTSWEAEGQATLAEELVGDDVLGNTSYQNYGHTVAFGTSGFDWYADEILKWAQYYGDNGAGVQAANAPDLCTVYGNISLSTPCYLAAFYGASWILQRYVGDQYGPGYPGGLKQLTRDWVSKNPSLYGTANVAALLGVNYDSLFVRFATALAVDDYDNGTGTAWVPPAFRITSWNSADLEQNLQSYYGWDWLNPPAMGFATATASRQVRGGSTAYTIVSATGAHPATAIRVTDPSGNALGTGLRPALWLIRVK